MIALFERAIAQDRGLCRFVLELMAEKIGSKQHGEQTEGGAMIKPNGVGDAERRLAEITTYLGSLHDEVLERLMLPLDKLLAAPAPSWAPGGPRYRGAIFA